MKTMKKLTCVMVALVLMLALCVTAFAAGTGSITVDNPRNGVTYTAYKIFDVVYDSKKEAYSYTIALNPKSPWYDIVNGYKGVKLTPTATGDVSIVEKTNEFSAAEFSNLLHANINGKTGIPLKAADGKATATGLDLGYYLVVGANEALANLTTTNPDVIIHDKNDVPFDKVDDKESVEVGEVVNYTITGKVPDTTGFTSYDYIITDTMSEGLTFNEDVKVYVDNAELTGNYTYEKVGNGFKVTIAVKDIQDKVTKPIVVQYTATVNEKAIAKISKNHAELVYSNDPTDRTKTDKRTDEETVYSAKIVIDKYDANVTDRSKKLKDAEFVLKNSEGKFYNYDTSAKKVAWVDTQEAAKVFVTDGNGVAEVRGLKDGTYTLIETKAPAGYNLLSETINVVVAGSDTDTTKLTYKVEVGNSTGSLLPSTGGIGTQIFYIAGAALLLGAVVVLLVKKFKKAEN